jgi:hypothetical protein
MSVVLGSCSTVGDYEYGYAKAYYELPEGFEKVEISGTSYWHQGGRFYRDEGERGYILVKPPRGHEAVVAASPGAAVPSPNAPAVAPATSSASSWGEGGFFGGGTLPEKRRPRNVGRSPLRR